MRNIMMSTNDFENPFFFSLLPFCCVKKLGIANCKLFLDLYCIMTLSYDCARPYRYSNVLRMRSTLSNTHAQLIQRGLRFRSDDDHYQSRHRISCRNRDEEPETRAETLVFYIEESCDEVITAIPDCEQETLTRSTILEEDNQLPTLEPPWLPPASLCTVRSRHVLKFTSLQRCAEK